MRAFLFALGDERLLIHASSSLVSFHRRCSRGRGGLVWIVKRPGRLSQTLAPPLERQLPREMRFPVVPPNQPQPPEVVITGRCWVIDGDTIVIDNVHIRLAGIDAPELDHPWGQQSKWTMVKLCKGQTITARIKPEMSYDRVVAQCFLPDGRDLAAELVKAGLALDWPKFSGGRYRALEPPDVRKKLWRASLRQRGLMPQGKAGDLPVVRRPSPVYTPQPAAMARGAQRFVRFWQTNYSLGWLAIAAAIGVLLVGCNLVGGNAGHATPETASRPAPSPASFVVTATLLNVRKEPQARSPVIHQLEQGTVIVPLRMSGHWYGIEMIDGSTGWVHRDFLRPVED